MKKKKKTTEEYKQKISSTHYKYIESVMIRKNTRIKYYGYRVQLRIEVGWIGRIYFYKINDNTVGNR